MKIVNLGVVYLFSCDECGTKFVHGVNKVKDYGFSHYKCECPHCGNLVEGVREDQIFNGEMDKDEHTNCKQDIH